MKNLKNQKGITLVALVITIIVLLILAGISLNLVMGENGILGRATSAVDTNNEATIREKINMVLAGYVEEYYEDLYVNKSGVQASGVTLESFIAAKAPASSNAVKVVDDCYITISGTTVNVYKEAAKTTQLYTGTLGAGGLVGKLTVPSSGS